MSKPNYLSNLKKRSVEIDIFVLFDLLFNYFSFIEIKLHVYLFVYIYLYLN